jgi:hypothetical protein
VGHPGVLPDLLPLADMPDIVINREDLQGLELSAGGSARIRGHSPYA